MSMRRMLVLAAVTLAAAIAPVDAKTLRWSTQGDVATHDPHAQNESFTNEFNGQIYEQLLTRDKEMKIVPCLATEYKQTGPNTWVFKLRQGVKWQDGSAFTADDVVFSVLRSQQPTSNMKVYGNAIGRGPCMEVSAEPDVERVLKRNPKWWGIKEGRFEGNVDEIVYRPIRNAGTREAALLSGEIDFVLDPPVQDLEKFKQDKKLKVYEGRENRIIFIGMDQNRDELLYSDVKGKNPFKDKKVRQAMYQAVDVQALKTAVMRGLSVPTAINLPAPKGAGIPDSMDKRYPFDVAASKKLLAEAGYPNGFTVTIDCPNDRYINDEKICVALAGMWSKIGVNVRVAAIPKANFFPKVQKLDTSMYMLGWGGATSDAIFTLKPVLHSRNDKGAGEYNWGNYKIPEFDKLIDDAEGEMDHAKRQDMIIKAMQMHHDSVLHIPLHLQVIPWVSLANVSVVHRPDNWLEVAWVKIN